MRILIVGAGGHAQVVADAIASRRLLGEEHTVVGFLDDEENLQEAPRPGTIVLGKISQAKEFEHDAVVMGIGDNRTRAKIYAQLVGANERIMTVIHARATVAPHVVIGDGTVVVAGAVINPGASIGPNVIINTGATVDHHNKVEAHVHLCPGVHLGGTVTIREGAFLGIGCSVLPNKTVGPWSVVGSGAVVIRDVPAGVTVVGVPAREMRKR